MSGTNNIFGRKTVAAKPKNLPKYKSQKPRKTRSDKKHDIKFRLSSDDKKLLKLRSMDHQLSLTAFASLLVKNDLIKRKEYQKFSYDKNGHFIHVTLENDYFEMVKILSADWDLPYRKVVHRIIKQYLETQRGITIHHYK